MNIIKVKANIYLQYKDMQSTYRVKNKRITLCIKIKIFSLTIQTRNVELFKSLVLRILGYAIEI